MLGISKRTLVACTLLMLPWLALSASAVENSINGVSVIPAGGKVRVEISTAGDVTFNTFVMTDPERLVINCVGAKYNVPWQKIDINNPLVSKVRTSQFQVDPVAISRVVLDLNKEVDYKTWAEGNVQIVEITGRSPGAMNPDVKESAELLQPLSIAQAAAPAKPAPKETTRQTAGASNATVEASMGPFLPYIPTLAPASQSAKQPAKPQAASVPVEAPQPAHPTIEASRIAQAVADAMAPPAIIMPAKAAPEPVKLANEQAAEAKSPVPAPAPSVEAKPEAKPEAKLEAPTTVLAKADEPKQAAPTPEKTKVELSPAADSESPWLSEGETSDEDTSPVDEVSTNKAQNTASRGDKEQAFSWSESYARGNPAAGSGVGTGSRRITIDAQGADIKTVLRTISDYSGKNIVYGPDVKGDVYIHIKDVPWEEALDIILRAHGYGYREEYGMIRVAEMDRLMKEEIDIQGAERKKDELLPLLTRIIFVNNSNAEELKTALQNIVSERGKIDVDRGSNALIVNDTEPVLAKMSEMVKALDKKTFQVDINAKLVEVDVSATRELGINWGLLNLHAEGFSGAGSAAVTSDIASSAGTVKFGTVRSWGELTAVLESLERSNKADIISNPRITTMDNREASILVGKEIPLIVADEAGNPITELTKIGIMLKVTPHVNADKTITLDMHPEVSDLTDQSTSQGGVIISTSEADTRVVVANGATAVIGGLIKNSDTSDRRGVPVLKDIPILGHLFSSSSKSNNKQELVIFVTPTIVE
jgi:type II secretory pathway component GspD/PulD (secretin)